MFVPELIVAFRPLATVYIQRMAPNINRLNLLCWHNWICGPPAAKFTRLASHKSSLIGCYGRITSITGPKCYSSSSGSLATETVDSICRFLFAKYSYYFGKQTHIFQLLIFTVKFCDWLQKRT